MYLDFNCYPLSPLNHIPHPSPCFYEDASTHTQPLHPQHPGIILHPAIKFSEDQGLFLLLMLDNAFLCYMYDWSHGSLCMYWLVGGLALGTLVWSGCLILFLFLWGCKHIQLLQFFSFGVFLFSPMVSCYHAHLYSRATAEPFRSHTYVAPLSWTSWLNKVWLGLVAAYGMDHLVGRSLMTFFSVPSLLFVSVLPLLSILFFLPRRNEGFTFSSAFFSSFICEFFLGIQSFWPNFHFSVCVFSCDWVTSLRRIFSSCIHLLKNFM